MAAEFKKKVSQRTQMGKGSEAYKSTVGVKGLALIPPEVALVNFASREIVSTRNLGSVDVVAMDTSRFSGWGYRQKATIGPAAGASTNYLVPITVHSGNGTSSGTDVYLNGHCTSFPNDIKVTADDGITLLNFFVDDLTADPCTIWVQVAADLSSVSQAIYIYYGKSGQSSLSNGKNTFPFFDHFDGASLDTSLWDAYNVNSASAPSVANSSLVLTLLGSGFGGCGLTSHNPLPTKDYVIEARVMQSTGSTQGELGLRVGTTNKASQDLTYYGEWNVNAFGALADDNNGHGLIADYPANRTVGTESPDYYGYWCNISAFIKDSAMTTKAIFTYNGTTHTVGPTSPGTEFSPLYVQISEGDVNTIETGYVDWIGVRPYVDPEPAISSWGSEETGPSNTYDLASLPASLSSSLLMGLSVTLTYNPATGYVFDHWETTGLVSVGDSTSQTTSLTVTGLGTVTAVYKLAGTCPTGEQVTNGSFGTGDFTGWTTSNVGPGKGEVLSDGAYQGTYYCRLYDQPLYSPNPTITQNFKNTVPSTCLTGTSVFHIALRPLIDFSPPYGGIADIRLLYTDGTETEIILGPPAAWTVYDLKPYVVAGKTLKGITIEYPAIGTNFYIDIGLVTLIP